MGAKLLARLRGESKSGGAKSNALPLKGDTDVDLRSISSPQSEEAMSLVPLPPSPPDARRIFDTSLPSRVRGDADGICGHSAERLDADVLRRKEPIICWSPKPPKDAPPEPSASSGRNGEQRCESPEKDE